MKTQEEFLSEFNSFPELDKELIKECGISFEELAKNPEKFLNNMPERLGKRANDFFCENSELILRRIWYFEEFEGLMNKSEYWEGEMTAAEFLIGFCWSAMIGELIDYVNYED